MITGAAQVDGTRPQDLAEQKALIAARFRSTE
jgi:hypothetical protein